MEGAWGRRVAVVRYRHLYRSRVRLDLAVDDAEARKVPPLYWVVNEAGNPVVLEAGSGGTKYDFFSFFTTREKAQRYYDQSYMQNKCITSSEDAEELVQLVREKAPLYFAFLFDIEGVEGQDAQPVTASEVTEIIEGNVGADEWDLGF